MSFPLLPIRLDAKFVACSRAARTAISVALDAVSCMTPPPVLVDRNLSGRPRAGTSQSSTRVSSSVHAGLVAHSIPCTSRPDDNKSPRIAGPDAFEGKYAKKFGDCQ